MKGQIRVLLHLEVPSHEETHVETLYHQVSRELAGTTGLIGNELLQGIGNRSEWAVLSEWQDMAAFQEWEAGAAHRGITAPLRPFQNRSAGAVFGAYEVRARH